MRSTPDPGCDRCQHIARYHHQHGCGACHYRDCACARFALAPHQGERFVTPVNDTSPQTELALAA